MGVGQEATSAFLGVARMPPSVRDPCMVIDGDKRHLPACVTTVSRRSPVARCPSSQYGPLFRIDVVQVTRPFVLVAPHRLASGRINAQGQHG